MSLTATVLAIVVSGVLGYSLGVVKFFREEKQKAYRELLPPILRIAFRLPRRPPDEKEFNEALSKLWLYGSKKVAKKMDTAVAIMHDHSRGDMIRGFQEAIIAMRNDIQILPWLPWRRLKPEEVKHFYSHIVESVVKEQKIPKK